MTLAGGFFFGLGLIFSAIVCGLLIVGTFVGVLCLLDRSNKRYLARKRAR